MEEQQKPVGSVAEEAAKLFDALRDWTADLGQGQADTKADAKTNTRADGEHTEPCAECRICPICRGIAVFRAISPEVKSHLASAATLFVQNLAEAMETATPDEYSPHRSGAADRQKRNDEEQAPPSDVD